MRYLDLAIAAIIGVSALAALATWSPSSTNTAADSQMSELHLRDALLAYVQRQGAAWLLSTKTSGVCDSITSLSNSTFTFSAIINSVPCSPSPHEGAVANLTLPFDGRTMVFEAWSAEEA